MTKLQVSSASCFREVPAPDWLNDPWEKIGAFGMLTAMILDHARQVDRIVRYGGAPPEVPDHYYTLVYRYLEEWGKG